jgi:hypothetical protein
MSLVIGGDLDSLAANGDFCAWAHADPVAAHTASRLRVMLGRVSAGQDPVIMRLPGDGICATV